MPRGIHASTAAVLGDDSTINAYLLTIDIGSPSLRYTSTPYAISYGGNTYTPSSQLRRLPDVQESAELRVGSSTFEFGGADQTYISLFFNNDHIGAQVDYSRAILDASRAVIGEPIVLFSGEISGVSMQYQGREVFVSMTCASHWANFSALSGRYSNDRSQQTFFPGDLFAEFAPLTVNDAPWGRK